MTVVVMWGSGIHQEKWNPKIKLANTTKKQREIVQTDKFVDEIDERRNLFLIQYGLVIYRFVIACFIVDWFSISKLLRDVWIAY